MPKTDLSSYFSNTDGSNGDYYAELDFAGSSLQTSDGDSFTKVIAPFKVAETPKTIVYVNDITVNENRGWEQLEVTLSKPATETFTINYKFTGGDASQNSDYWWWSNNEGYRQITFLEGQSNAIINVDVSNDNEAESTETFNIEMILDSASSNVAILGTDQVTVTIIDDDSSSAGATDSVDTEALVAKIISKVSAAIATEIKAVTDANSGTLDSTAATYSEILLNGNSGITDVAAFITAEVTEESGIYDSIISAVMSVVQTYTTYLRGPNQTDLGYGIDSIAVANDIAALTIAINNVDLSTSSFISASADATAEGKVALQNAIGNDIYSNSGFKYDSEAQIIDNKIVSQKTIDTNGSVYDDVLMPVGSGIINTQWDNIDSVTLGTSGNDTVTVSNSGVRDVLYNGGAGNDVITAGSDLKAFIQGGAGNDTIKTTSNEYHRLQGGAGDDILSAANFNKVLYEGGTGNDLFVIEATSETWSSSQNFQGNDRNNDFKTDFFEMYQRPGVIYDFKDGADKIALKGDWSSKTVVIKQGTNEGNLYNSDMSQHTVIYSSSKDSGGNYDQIIAILANTQATSISADDFVTVDSSYTATAISSAVSSVSFASSLTFNGGTYVGPAQSGVIIYNTSDSAPINFTITGGNDAGLFDIDVYTGALTFKTSKTLADSQDFNRDGTYDVAVTATQGSSSVNGNVGVSISTDTTFASYSNLELVTSTDSQGQTVVYMTGTLTDDSAALTTGEIYLRLMHVSKGTTIDFRAQNTNYEEGSIDADGSFKTRAQTIDGTTPDGTYFVQYLYLEDDAGNRYSEYYRRAEDSSPFKGTLVNPLYLGNSDTTTASYSDLAVKYTTVGSDTEMSITGKVTDDGNPLLVAEIQFRLTNKVTGIEKWFYFDSGNSIAADGSFETRGERLSSSDPDGTWAITYLRLMDDAGNEFTENYNSAYDSSPLKVEVTNSLYLGNTDKTVASVSNLAVVETQDYQGNPALIVTGTLSEDSQEVNIRLVHSKSGTEKWFYAGEYAINSDGTFETYAESFRNSDPSGTWFIEYLAIKDLSGNRIEKTWQDAQESSPLKVSITNSSYSGGQSGESSASDLTAPVLSNLALTVVNDGDGTYSLKITGNATDVGSKVNYASFRLGNTADHAISKIVINIEENQIDDTTGAFEVTKSLEGQASGTYILQRYEVRDENGLRTEEQLHTGGADSPLLGLSFNYTTGTSASDVAAPTVSNLTAVKTNDGDDTYTLTLSGILSDATAMDTGSNYLEVRFTNVTNGEGSDFYMNVNGSSINQSTGAFSITRSLDNEKGGTWNADRIVLRENANSQETQISKAGAGSPLSGLTFSLASGSESSTDYTIPSLSNLSAAISADGDGTYTLTFTGTATDASGTEYTYFRFKNESGNTIDLGTGSYDGSGNFTMTHSMDSESPGTYTIDYYYFRDSAGNEISKDVQSGGTGSPQLGLSFSYATAPSAITFTATSVAEETLGASLGKVSVNGVEALGLYTLTLGGAEASSLEITSKGYLRLKDNVKLDYETDTTLDFTIKAVNASNEEVTTTFSIAVTDNGLVGSSIDMSGIDGILLDPDAGIQFIPGGDIEKQDETVDLSTLGITVDSIEELDAFISNPDQEDLKELLKDQATNEIEEEVISEKSSSLEVLVITDDVIDEDELLYSVDII